MTEEQIAEYRILKLDLQEVNEDISKSTVHDSTKGSQKNFPWVLSTRHIIGVTDENSNLLIQKSDTEAKIKEIESFVNNIQDKKIRKIITLRYMKGKKAPSWLNIAMKLGYRSEHTPQRKSKKFFEMAEMADFQ